MLSRSTILATLTPIATTVPCPELGGDIGIRRLSFAEAINLADSAGRAGDNPYAQEDFLLELVMACACDDQGDALFQPTDRPQLRRLPATCLQRLANVALEVNNLDGQGLERAEGNSDAIPGDAGS